MDEIWDVTESVSEGFLTCSSILGVAMWDGAEIEDIPMFKVRSDDVWVCSFPRSGIYTEYRGSYTSGHSNEIYETSLRRG